MDVLCRYKILYVVLQHALSHPKPRQIIKEEKGAYCLLTKLLGIRSVRTWDDLLNILTLDVLSFIAYSPSVDQTNSSAELNDLFLHAKGVYIMYSPSPQTMTNLPFGLFFKV